jgi:hypothetical protein
LNTTQSFCRAAHKPTQLDLLKEPGLQVDFAVTIFGQW